MAHKASSIFRCGKCGAAVSADAVKCEACAFVFGSEPKLESRLRPHLVVLVQLLALALTVLSAPFLVFGPVLALWRPAALLVILVPAGSLLVFWGLAEPKPWARTAAIVFAGLLSLVALLLVGVLAQAGAVEAVVFASIVFLVLVWFTVALSRSREVRNFVADTHDYGAI